jgi:hypothetical protein
VMLPRRKMPESVLNICSSVAVGMSRADKAIWETQVVQWGRYVNISGGESATCGSTYAQTFKVLLVVDVRDRVASALVKVVVVLNRRQNGPGLCGAACGYNVKRERQCLVSR